MGLRRLQPERLTFGFVFQIDMLELLVHHFCKLLCLLLRDLGVLKLVVKMILGLLNIREPNEEFGLDFSLVFRLVYCVHKLRFV